jgi:hypothetical protein
MGDFVFYLSLTGLMTLDNLSVAVLIKDWERQMGNPIRLRRKIVELEELLVVMRTKKEELLKNLREECDHQIIVETPYSGNEPPRRICVFCGLEEEGWNCGYKELQQEPIMVVERDTFYKFRSLSFATLKKGLIPSFTT